MRAGRVTTFDERSGLGEVTEEADATDAGEGGAVHGFHCTQIADGSRTIAVGTEVEFDVVPAQLGRWEAANLRPRS